MQRLAPGPHVVIKTTTKQSTRNTEPEEGEMWIRFIGLQQGKGGGMWAQGEEQAN